MADQEEDMSHIVIKMLTALIGMLIRWRDRLSQGREAYVAFILSEGWEMREDALVVAGTLGVSGDTWRNFPGDDTEDVVPKFRVAEHGRAVCMHVSDPGEHIVQIPIDGMVWTDPQYPDAGTFAAFSSRRRARQWVRKEADGRRVLSVSEANCLDAASTGTTLEDQLRYEGEFGGL